MGSKIDVSVLSNLLGSSFLTALNDNLDDLADEFDSVLYRDGSHSWLGNMNANSKRLYNLPAPVYDHEPLRAADLDSVLKGEPGVGRPFPTRAAMAAESVIDADDTGVFLSEPGREGIFVYDNSDFSALISIDTNQGLFVPPAADVTGASGAWVRRINGPVNIKWFGVAADGVTNDGPKFVAAITLLKAIGVNVSGTSLASTSLFIPAGDYYLGTSVLDLPHTFITQGEGSGLVGGVATRLSWAGTTPGIRLQAHNTSGDHLVVASHSSSAGAQLRGLFLTSNSIADPTSHAIDAMARFSAIDVGIYNWGGNGFNIKATAGGGAGNEGNANCFSIINCHAYGCKNGLYMFGADANAGTIVGGDFSMNREFGDLDQSFLGNSRFGVHYAGNVSGPFKGENVNASSVWFGCYTEGGQPEALPGPGGMVVGGTQGAGVGSGQNWLNAFDYSMRFLSDTRIQPAAGTASFTINGPATNILFFGGTAYNTCDMQVYATPTAAGINTVFPSKFEFTFTDAFSSGAEIDADGVNVPAGNWYEVAGVKVLGTQQAAVADAAALTSVDATNAAGVPTQAEFNAFVAEFNKLRTDLAATRTQLNSTLAKLRTHGIIAT